MNVLEGRVLYDEELCVFKHGYVNKHAVLVNAVDRQAVWNWCEERKIKIQYEGYDLTHDKDLWYVINKKNRTMFILRWGGE